MAQVLRSDCPLEEGYQLGLYNKGGLLQINPRSHKTCFQYMLSFKQEIRFVIAETLPFESKINYNLEQIYYPGNYSSKF